MMYSAGWDSCWRQICAFAIDCQGLHPMSRAASAVPFAVQVEKIFVVKMGEIELLNADGQAVNDPTFVKEAGGFTFFGDACLDAITRCPYTVSPREVPTFPFLAAVS
jgi:hypothetical protein